MPVHFIYPIYTAVLSFLMLAVVPKQAIRRLAFYGVFFGALLDIIMVLLLTKIIGVGGYTNLGPFGFMGIPFFPPIAWVAFFVLFLYFLPRKKPWDYIYVIGAAGYGTMFSNVLQNLGIFEWNYGNLIVPYIIYLSWFTFFTWVHYQLAGGVEKKLQGETSTPKVANKKGFNVPTVKRPRPELNFFKKKRIK